MTKWVSRIVSTVLILGGLYGLAATAMFLRQKVFSYNESAVEANAYWDRWVQPGIEDRTARLDLTSLARAEKTNVEKIVRWMAIDHDSARNLAMRGHVASFSLAFSLFSIIIGILCIVWARQTELRKEIQKIAQQGAGTLR